MRAIYENIDQGLTKEVIEKYFLLYNKLAFVSKNQHIRMPIDLYIMVLEIHLITDIVPNLQIDNH